MTNTECTPKGHRRMHAMHKRQLWSYLFIVLIVLAVLPYGFLSFMPVSTHSLWILGRLLVVGIATIVVLLSVRHCPLRLAFIAGIAAYYLLLYTLISFWHFTRNLFDPFLVLEMGGEARDILRVLGNQEALLIAGGLLLFFSLLCTMLYGLTQIARMEKTSWPRLILTICIALFGILQAPRVLGQFTRAGEGRKAAELQDIVALPKPFDGQTHAQENVFIVQLESANSLALTGKLSANGIPYRGSYMPTLSSIARLGVFFPNFFSNQQVTNRAMEAILCGIPGNTGKGLYERLDDLPGDMCLPSVLAKSGYRTLFYSSHDNPDFMHNRALAEKMGFTSQHYAEIAHEEDRRRKWGIDDCDYYKRVFENLQSETDDPERLFVYIQMNAAHANFSLKEGYETMAPFPQPKNYLEKYLDAMSAQDVCLGNFFRKVQEYAGENSHIIIVGDHPFGLQEGYAKFDGRAENFLVPFAYIPPRSRRDDFRENVVDTAPAYSQSDIIPTILDLLNDQPYQNSFASALRKPQSQWLALLGSTESPYEHCHIMHSIYDGATTAVLQGNDKYTYSHSDQKVYYANISVDLLEQNRVLIGENVPFQDFLRDHRCQRFQWKSDNPQ